MMGNEKYVAVPLEKNMVAALNARAERNGRSVGREAAKMVEGVLLRALRREANSESYVATNGEVRHG